jgi:PTH2 family peptidyl-tRNA hydrolase
MGELRMYILINSTLKMSKGKVAGQACHACQYITEFMINNRPEQFQRYKNIAPKIILRSDERQMRKLLAKYSDASKPVYCIPVYDLGRTQVPPNSFTALGFIPMSEQIEELIHLPLF